MGKNVCNNNPMVTQYFLTQFLLYGTLHSPIKNTCGANSSGDTNTVPKMSSVAASRMLSFATCGTRGAGAIRGGGGASNGKCLLEEFAYQSSNGLEGSKRYKHSNTQIKRLFKQNPANLRAMARNDTLPRREFLPPLDPMYPPRFTVDRVLPNGWTAPPPNQTELIQDLPFGILRTPAKCGAIAGFLPVYSDFRLGGTRATTIVRRVTGNQTVFLRELKAALKLSPETDKIRLRAGGTTIEVKGNRTKEIKSWLSGLGF